MHGRPIYTSLLATAAVALLVAGCTKLPPAPTYDDYVARWVGDTEVGLVSAWGIPGKTHGLETGGRIVEYARQREGATECTTRFTIDGQGKIIKYWYHGSKCRAPLGV